MATRLGIKDGERLEIETNNDVILLRRVPGWNRADALAAAEEIIAEAKNHSLGDVTIRELIDDGRRW